MSRRIFVLVDRGPMDKTAICVFPWEVAILGLIHGDNVKQVSIDEMCNLGDGVVKVEKQKLKNKKGTPAPDLRIQLEIMSWVDPDQDPARDVGGEYTRMMNKYGMDKEFPMPCVERIYGQFTGGGFEAAVRKHEKDRVPKPKYLQAAEEGLDMAPSQMTVAQLRDALDERSVDWTPKLTKGQLADLLEKNLAPA